MALGHPCCWLGLRAGGHGRTGPKGRLWPGPQAESPLFILSRILTGVGWSGERGQACKYSCWTPAGEVPAWAGGGSWGPAVGTWGEPLKSLTSWRTHRMICVDAAQAVCTTILR